MEELLNKTAGALALLLFSIQLPAIERLNPNLGSSKPSETLCLEQFKIPSMGTIFEIQLASTCGHDQSPFLKSAQEILKNWEEHFSLYQENSPISRLNKNGFHKDPSAIFNEGLRESIRHFHSTYGQFNILVEPILSEIRKSFTKDHRPPDLRVLDSMKSLLKIENIQVTENHVNFSVSGTKMTLDGIVKGMAVDKVAELAESAGLMNYLINFSGNMRWKGSPPGKRRWILKAWNPVKAKAFNVEVPKEGAMASSGPEHNSYDEKFAWHHLISPATLRPAHFWLQTTVIGPSAGDCDVLSTATFVSDKRLLKKILKNYGGYKAYTVDARGKIHLFKLQ